MKIVTFRWPATPTCHHRKQDTQDAPAHDHVVQLYNAKRRDAKNCISRDKGRGNSGIKIKQMTLLCDMVSLIFAVLGDDEGGGGNDFVNSGDGN